VNRADIDKITATRIEYLESTNYKIVIKIGITEKAGKIHRYTKEHYAQKIVLSACNEVIVLLTIRDTISNEVVLTVSEGKGELIMARLKKLSDKIDYHRISEKEAK